MGIRIFNEKDTQAVINLWLSCGLIRPWNNPKKDIERKTKLNDDGFVVIEDICHDDKIIASVMFGYDGHRGNVYYLAVHPDYQKQSLGRQLMDYVEAQLKAQGCPKINLMVRSDNRAVNAFYQAFGYDVNEVNVLGKRLIEDE